MKKKWFAFLLIFCLILSGPCVHAAVGSGNFIYEVNEDSVRITQYQSIFLERLEIPETIDGKPVTTIGTGAFWNCSKMKDVTLPKTLKTIEAIAFIYCSGIRNVYISDLAAWCGMYIEGQESNPLYYADNLYVNGVLTKNMVIPDGVTSIGQNAFRRYEGLAEVTIPASVIHIGKNAFYECKNMKKLHIADIGAWCNINFENAETNPLYYTGGMYLNGELVTQLEIPDGVTSISANAFYNNQKMTTVVIPESVTSIGDGAFSECSGIKRVLYLGDEAQWAKVSIGNSNTALTNTEIVFRATEKTYSFESNSDEKISDVKGYAVLEAPIPQDENKVFLGWYDNPELSGDAVEFPYCGDATTLYAKWREKNGTSFDEAIPTVLNQDYTVITAEPNQTVYYKFKPSSAEEYRIFSSGNIDTTVQMFTSNQELMLSDPNVGNANFCITPTLNAGETYYIAVSSSAEAGTFTLHVRKNFCTYKFAKEDGTAILESTVPYGTVLAGTPAGPDKEADQQYTYAFAGWEGYTDGMVVTQDVCFMPKYTHTLNQYTYRFVDEDGTLLLEKTEDYGTKIEPPQAPSKPSTLQYTYTFAEWEGYSEDMTLTENATFTAKYHVLTNRYTYKFLDEDGTVLLEKTEDYGTKIELPQAPSKPSTAQYSYIFAGWEGYGEDMTLTEDVTFTAKYDSLINQYTYKFVNEDGTVLSEKTEDYGTKIELPQPPSKPSDAQYTYTFVGWDGYSENMMLEKDVTFTAKYDSLTNQYTYQFLDEDGTVLLEKTEDYGTEITLPLPPSKPSTAQYSYTFVGWNGYIDGMQVTQDAVFTANYQPTVNCYTYKFISEGNVVSEITAEYGAEIKLPADPVKASTQQYTYIFSGWEGYQKGMAVTKDETFTAIYTSKVNKYTYKFWDDGKVVFEKTVDYGTKIELPPNPFRAPTQEFTYTFDGWDGYTSGMKITEDVSFISRYSATVNQYTYKFVNYDGSVVSEGTLDFGSEIPNPSTPFKPSTQQFIYPFAGWSGFTSGMKLTGDIAFTALYNEVLQKYTYQFIADGNVYYEETVDYGTVVHLPENPVKPATAQYSYTFDGWEGYNENMVVTDDVMFTAKYNATINQYTYQFIDEEGNVLQKKTADYGTAITNAPDVPFHGISIIGAWQNYADGMELTEDITFVPVYTLMDYTVNISGTTETATVTYSKEYHIHPVEKEGYAFVGYFDEADSKGNRLTDENGDSYAPYLVDGDFTVYPYYVPMESTENQIRFIGDADVYIGHPNGINLSTVLKNYQGNGSYFRLSLRLPQDIVPVILENEYWKDIKQMSKTVQDGIAVVTFHCNFSKTEPHDPILELRLKTKEPMEAGNAAIQIVDASVVDENGEIIKEYGEKFVHNVMLRHHSVDAMEIRGEDIVFGGLLSTYSINITPSYADKSVTWSVDDETVATIDENGILTPLREGHVVITARSLLTDTVFATKHIEVKVMKLDSMTTDIGVWDKPFDPYGGSFTIYVDESVNVVTMTPTYTEDGVLHFSGKEVKSGEGKKILLNKNEVKTSCIFRANTTLASTEYNFTFIKRNGIYANVSEDKSVVDVELVGAPENTAVLVAYFKDKKLIGLQNQIYTGEKMVFHINDDYRTLKVLAWYKLDRPAPVFPAETFVFD